MIIKFPQVPAAYSQSFFTALFQNLAARFPFVVATNEAVPRVILQSPNGKSWNVEVDDSGTLVVTQNTGTIQER